ncbi:MAG TPA: Omp28-related outer membrane protein [Flavobacteriales bacterium]|nr:Omp28-related outer membrane protein [Flavobacteriales bacterium]
MRLATLLTIAPIALSAQTLVSTMPQNRTGILEEFTAINCPNCPQGHTVAADLVANNPGQLIVVGVHGGGLAIPSGNQPDFRTTWGTSIWSQFGVNAQPLGIMNRTAHNSQLVIGRTNWPNALTANLALPSPVNIGAATQFDQGTRDLSVEVEVYYAGNGAGGNDHLHVLLTENDIIGFQANGSANYSHQHVLRSYITPLWGEEMTNNTQGTLDTRSYTFNVPMGWNIDNCHVVAFVGEYQGEIHNAVEIGANNFSTGVQDVSDTQGLSIYPQPATDRLFISTNASGAMNYEITDMGGRLIASANTTSGSTISIDVSALNNGVYLLRVDGHAQRFVVAR